MKPWEILDTVGTPDGRRLELRRHDTDYVIYTDGYDLMTSRAHTSEDSMMAIACPHPRADACVLIGGLGMGYTLRAALDALSERGHVVVVELMPRVVEWNRGQLGPLAGHPLQDPRVELVVGDVARIIRTSTARFDTILLDVDNGPDAFTQRNNRWLYTATGLAAGHAALRPGGSLAVWSVGEEVTFEGRLQRAGFTPTTHRIAAHGARGRRHVVFVGRRHELPRVSSQRAPARAAAPRTARPSKASPPRR